MRFTLLLTDRNDGSDLRLLLDAGYQYQSYITYWHKVFYPGVPPLLEYIKVGRVFRSRGHLVVVVMIENYRRSSLSVAHHLQTGNDLATWVSRQPRTASQHITRAIRHVLLAVSGTPQLSGVLLGIMRQGIITCAKLGVVTIDRVRHSETSLEQRVRLLATEADKHLGSVAFRNGTLTPAVRVTIRSRRLRLSLLALVESLGLSAHSIIVAGSAKSLEEGATANSLVTLRPPPETVLGKRTREMFEAYIENYIPRKRRSHAKHSKPCRKRKRDDADTE